MTPAVFSFSTRAREEELSSSVALIFFPFTVMKSVCIFFSFDGSNFAAGKSFAQDKNSENIVIKKNKNVFSYQMNS